MTKVLIVRPGPSFAVQDVAFGWRDALRDLGCTVGDFNYDDRLDFYAGCTFNDRKPFDDEQGARLAAEGIHAACYKFLPDIVIVVMATFVPVETLELMRERGHKVVVICTESPYEDDRQMRYAPVTDCLILNDPTHLDRFRAVNPNTFYVPHAYDPAKHFPGPGTADLKCDFTFVGTGFPSRVKLLEEIDLDGLDVLLGGNWSKLDERSPIRKYVGHDLNECTPNDVTAEMYRSATTSLNLYRREAQRDGLIPGASIGPREVELAACGCWFVRDPRPEGDEVFDMLPTFSEPGEVRPLIDWALSHPRERELAAVGARAAIEDRTFTKNAAWLLHHLNR